MLKFKKGDTVIYPQHGACIVVGTKKMEAFGGTQEYLILRTVINDYSRKDSTRFWLTMLLYASVVLTVALGTFVIFTFDPSMKG